MSARKQIIKKTLLYLYMYWSIIYSWGMPGKHMCRDGKMLMFNRKRLRPNPSCWEDSANRHTAPKVNNIYNALMKTITLWTFTVKVENTNYQNSTWKSVGDQWVIHNFPRICRFRADWLTVISLVSPGLCCKFSLDKMRVKVHAVPFIPCLHTHFLCQTEVVIFHVLHHLICWGWTKLVLSCHKSFLPFIPSVPDAAVRRHLQKPRINLWTKTTRSARHVWTRLPGTKGKVKNRVK